MAAYTTIDDPELYFQTKIYTGDGNDDRDIVFDVTDTSMQPNMLWSARRDSGDNISLYDSVRGDGKEFRTAESAGEYDSSDNIQALNSNGFQVGTDGQVNADGGTYVSWAWKETADAGFDMVAYTGNQTARTISHSLSAVPHWMIIKNRSNYSFQVYHHKNTSAPETEIMYLNTTAATSDSNVEWNDTAPTSSVFTVGTDVGVNENTKAMIAYLFTEKQGFSKFGVYTGNNNANGNFIYTGFRPAFVLSKDIDSGQSWHMHDHKRDTFNDDDNAHLIPNVNDSEANAKTNRGTMKTDLLSNGFKLNTDGSHTNGTGNHIYMAFAEAPFVNSKGVPCNAR